MLKNWTTIAVIIGLLAGCASQPAGVGSYVTAEDGAAMMVQITSIDEGRVTGTVSVVTSEENGKTSAMTRSFSGTLEGKALNLSIENGYGVSLATGMLEGDRLRLTFFGNGNSQQILFAKSDATEFDRRVDATRIRSAEKKQEIETAAAQKERIEQRAKTQRAINVLADNLFEKARDIQEKAKRLDAVMAGYRSARDRVGKMQTTKRGIDVNSYDASYRIGEIDYQIDGLAHDMESAHRDVQSYAESVDRFMAETGSQSSSLMAECEADQLLDCARLSAAAQLLNSRNQEFRGAHSREKAAFEGKRGTKS